MKLPGKPIEPQLVNLEQPELAGDRAVAAGGIEQRRGDPAGHVGAGLVVHERDAGSARRCSRPSPRWWSCRWWRTPARCRGAGAPRARRSPSGSILTSSFPGRLVPPPPRKRETAPTARARASFGPSVALIALPRRRLGGPGGEEGIRARAVASARARALRRAIVLTRSGSSPIGSPSAYIVNGRSALIGDLARAKDFHAGLAHVRPAEHLRQDLRQEAELADAFEHHNVEQAIVEQRIRRRAHATAIGLRVAGSHRVARESVALARRVRARSGSVPGARTAERAAPHRRTRARQATREPRLRCGWLRCRSPRSRSPRTPARLCPTGLDLPRSSLREKPAATIAQASTGSAGMPSTRARSLPRPPGNTPSSAPGNSRSTSATAPTIPSPLKHTTVSPASAAASRQARARDRDRGSTRCEPDRPWPSSATSTSGSTRPAFPPPAEGFTIRQMGGSPRKRIAPWPRHRRAVGERHYWESRKDALRMREYGADLRDARLCCRDVRPLECRAPPAVRLGYGGLRARY